MVDKAAGIIETRMTHHGFLSLMGLMNHGRPGLVGCYEKKSLN